MGLFSGLGLKRWHKLAANSGYCVACRAEREFRDQPQIKLSRSGQPVLVGSCTDCETPMFRFLATGGAGKSRSRMVRVRVSPEVRDQIAAVAAFAHLSHGDIIAYLAKNHLDRLTIELAANFVSSGVKLKASDMPAYIAAKSRLVSSAAEPASFERLLNAAISALVGRGASPGSAASRRLLGSVLALEDADDEEEDEDSENNDEQEEE